MPTLLSLPNEVLGRISDMLMDDARAEWTAWNRYPPVSHILTCSRLYSEGMRALYSHPHLHPISLPSFINTITRRPELLGLIRSLTVRVHEDMRRPTTPPESPDFSFVDWSRTGEMTIRAMSRPASPGGIPNQHPQGPDPKDWDRSLNQLILLGRKMVEVEVERSRHVTVNGYPLSPPSASNTSPGLKLDFEDEFVKHSYWEYPLSAMRNRASSESSLDRGRELANHGSEQSLTETANGGKFKARERSPTPVEGPRPLPVDAYPLDDLYFEDCDYQRATSFEFLHALTQFSPRKAKINFHIGSVTRAEFRETLSTVMERWCRDGRLLAVAICPSTKQDFRSLVDTRLDFLRQIPCRHIRVLVPDGAHSLELFAGTRMDWKQPAGASKRWPAGWTSVTEAFNDDASASIIVLRHHTPTLVDKRVFPWNSSPLTAPLEEHMAVHATLQGPPHHRVSFAATVVPFTTHWLSRHDIPGRASLVNGHTLWIRTDTYEGRALWNGRDQRRRADLWGLDHTVPTLALTLMAARSRLRDFFNYVTSESPSSFPLDASPDDLLHPETQLFEVETHQADFEDARWWECGSQLPDQLCRIARGMSPWSLVSVGDRGFHEYTSRSNHDGSEDQQQSPYIAPESDFDFDLDDAEGDSQAADTEESGDD